MDICGRQLLGFTWLLQGDAPWWSVHAMKEMQSVSMKAVLQVIYTIEWHHCSASCAYHNVWVQLQHMRLWGHRALPLLSPDPV